MKRRTFLATACSALAGATAGCLSGTDPAPAPAIAVLELENHRRDRGYEFAVRVTEGESVVLEDRRHLGPAGSGESAAAYRDPVAEPGAYAVTVAVEDRSVTVETADLVSPGTDCLGLQFYLGARTLHAEHRTYRRCGETPSA